MNYIVYQAYGHKDILNECCYSILSLLKYTNTPSLKIVIYTDQKNYFQFLPQHQIEYVEMDNQTIQEYKGKHNFVHRVKIKVLEDFCTKYSGKFIYVDTDIYFFKNILPLFDTLSENHFLRCNNEGSITNKKNRVFVKFKKFIDQNSDYLNQQNIPISPSIQMWNAGVLGMTTAHSSIVEKTLNTNDIIYDRFSSHIVEQMSFTYQLLRSGVVSGSTDYLFHYWNFKEFRSVLKEYFDFHLNNKSTYEQLLSTIDLIKPNVLIAAKLEYEQLSLIPKTLRKLKGKKNRWKMPKYSIN